MGEIQRTSTSQRGAIAIMFAFTLMIMLGVIGIAIDTARLYNRQVELQKIADAIALAAANELNSTPAGVTKALAKASLTANELMYQYHGQHLTWTSTALKFSTSAAADATWVDSGAAGASPGGLLFAKVETDMFGAEVGLINSAFMHMFSSSLGVVNMSDRAVAGRSSLQVTPLAICAMSGSPGISKTRGSPPLYELEEYGFRRGVSYDLMKLPDEANARSFVMSPVDPPGTAGPPAHTAATLVEPFVCAGKMSMPRVIGAPITVASPFPIDSLYNALNSRFDQYTGSACTPDGAPPDANIKSYLKNSIPWMTSVVDQQTDTATNYGPLWSYAKAVPYASYTEGVAEPTNGYTPFALSAWPRLYEQAGIKPKAVVSGTYPNSTSPYRANSGLNFLAPSVGHRPGVRQRRVLRVALLACTPVPTATATVLAIGNFFMTVPATSTSISAEFAGIAQEQSLGGPVELFK